MREDSSPAVSSAGEVQEEFMRDSDFAPQVLGADEGNEYDDEDAIADAQTRAVSRIDAIINEATHQYAETSVHSESCTPEVQQPRPTTGRVQPPRGADVPNPAIASEITRILAASQKLKPVPESSSARNQVREYAERRNFGRGPAFLRNVEALLDAEQQYISSLPGDSEPPKTAVRLLTKSEKDELTLGLKQSFQQATALYLKAPPKSRSRNEIQAQLNKLTRDIENLSRPYIFVEDT